MKKILITGAGGYIASNLFEHLNCHKDKYYIEKISLRDSKWEEKKFSDFDIIFHTAGIAHSDSTKVTSEEKKMYYDVNHKLAVKVAEKAKKEGVKQFILMSSIIVYGECEHITVNIEAKPANFYGDSKWRADRDIKKLETDDFKVAVIRSPMVYGKDSKGNFPKLEKIALRTIIFPKCNNKRSVIYIKNLCELVKLIIDNNDTGIYFPQNPDIVSTDFIVKTIADSWKHKIFISRALGLAVKLINYVPGKIGRISKKAFGNKYYEKDMSVYRQKYQLYTTKESIYDMKKR